MALHNFSQDKVHSWGVTVQAELWDSILAADGCEEALQLPRFPCSHFVSHQNCLGGCLMPNIGLLGEYTRESLKSRNIFHTFIFFFMCFSSARCAKMFPLETLCEMINVKGFCNSGISLPSPESRHGSCVAALLCVLEALAAGNYHLLIFIFP